MPEKEKPQDALAELAGLVLHHYQDIDDVVAYCRAIREGHTHEEARQIANGEESNGPVSADVESYAATNWRAESPTEEGWYWINLPEDAFSPFIVHVWDSTEGLQADFVDGRTLSVPEIATDARWAGPIPEPTPEGEAEGAA